MKASSRALHGGSRLVFDTVEGITNSVERMHETIARHPLPWSTQPAELSRAHGPIASAVYSTIRGINGLLRQGLDQSFALLPQQPDGSQHSEAEIHAVAAINGAFGDHLEASGNSLALPMRLTTPHRLLDLNPEALMEAIPQPSGHLVILVHGLSMSELGWQREGTGDLGSLLQTERDCTPLYLRYNSGRHISTNGKEFAVLLDQLYKAWPVPVKSVSLIGHSMGGLVIRSACWYASEAQNQWLEQLTRVMCLGTPHHGSMIAKAGRVLNAVMEAIPYVEPLAFGRRRSAGIKDLQHGSLLDEDWQDEQGGTDKRTPVPLLPEIDYYFLAAMLGRDKHDPLGHVAGDMLVRKDSAVGAHSQEQHHLKIKPENCRVFHEKNHMDLLSDEQVHRQIVDWFEPTT